MVTQFIKRTIFLIPLLLLSLSNCNAINEIIKGGQFTMVWNGTRDGNTSWTGTGGLVEVTNGVLVTNYSGGRAVTNSFRIYNSTDINPDVNITVVGKLVDDSGGITDMIGIIGNGAAYSHGCLFRCASGNCYIYQSNTTNSATSDTFVLEKNVILNWTLTLNITDDKLDCSLYRNGVLNKTINSIKQETAANKNVYYFNTFTNNIAAASNITEIWANIANYIAPCSSGSSNEALRINLLNELTGSPINGTVDSTILIINNQSYVNYTMSGQSTFNFCVYPASAKYNISARFSYDNSSADYDRRYYFLNNVTLSNSSQTIDFYLIADADATNTPISVIDNTGNTVNDVLVVARREYLSLGGFRTISMVVTDSNGYGSMPLEWYNTRYDFQVINQSTNTIIKSSEPTTLMTSNSNPLTISISVGTVYDYWYRNNTLIYNTSYTNVTGLVNYTVNALDTSGLAASIKLTCTAIGMINNTLLYSNTITGQSISETCLLGNTTDKRFLINTLITYSDGTSISHSEEFDGTTNYDYSTDGLLGAFFVIISLALGLSVSPSASIMGLIIGLVIVMNLGFTLLSVNTIMMLVFGLIFILWLVKRGR